MVNVSQSTMENKAFSVLLVDDDPYACGIFQLVMDHHNLPLTIIHNAEDALNYLEANKPDVVVMDLFLPGLDGYRALERIRKAELAQAAKIVATTAYYTHDTPQEIYQRGFDGYIPKPFVATELVPYLKSLTA